MLPMRAIASVCWSAIILSAVLSHSGCGQPPQYAKRLTIAVSILPQKYFVEKIIGDTADIFVVVPPGANPASYEPSPSDMRNMSNADVWFTIGVPFETPWLPRFAGASPGLRIRSTIENIERLPIGRYAVASHETLSLHQVHSHGSLDPHVWLAPELVRVQAAVMAEELSLIDSSMADELAANLDSFNTEIDSIQNVIRTKVNSSDNRNFIVYHPAWGYFADEFDLIQIPVETAGSEPSPREMSLLIDYAREHGISVVFVSPQFSTSSADAISSGIGAVVITVDPLAEDWGRNLCSVAELLTGEAVSN